MYSVSFISGRSHYDNWVYNCSGYMGERMKTTPITVK